MEPDATRQEPGRRIAILVATDVYSDSTFQQLAAPGADARALADVLRDPAIGGYEVIVLVNAPAAHVARQIELAFTQARKNDVVLLYFSGHGIKDETGQLYLTATDSEHQLPRSTTVAAQFIREQLDRSICRRKIVLLDCCFGGAFPRGYTHRANETVHVHDQLGGRGCAVLTASTALEYAYEINGSEQIPAGGSRSVFTGVVVEALRTGAADLDGDGLVDVDELYRYTFAQVRDANPKQTPSLDCTFTGQLVITRNPHGPRLGFGLPSEVAEALRSPLPAVRAAAIGCVVEFLDSEYNTLAGHARDALRKLAVSDNDNNVAATAGAYLSSGPPRNQGNLGEDISRLVADHAAQQEYANRFLVNMAKRSHSIIQRQLGVVERLEQVAEDPEQLVFAFEVDQLAVRMRRLFESVLVLADADLSREIGRNLAFSDVLRGAVSEIEQYSRVFLAAPPSVEVRGYANNHLVHLIAELLENATYFSPPETMVEVRTELTSDRGLLIEIADRGTGMSVDEIASANQKLANPIHLDASAIQRAGLYVVSRLANRHKMGVELRLNGYGGITASIRVPAELILS